MPPMIVCVTTARLSWYVYKNLQWRWMADPGRTNSEKNIGRWPITPEYLLRKNKTDPHCLKLQCDQNSRRSRSKVNV